MHVSEGDVPQLVARSMTFRYARSDRIFGPFDQTFYHGRLCALWGPSGSGKTTFLSLLGGLLTPTGGTVRLTCDGDDEQVGPRSVAWVFQHSNALLSRTLLDNVLLSSRFSASRKDSPVDVAAVLADVGLAGMEEALCRDLSGGERQRMCVARAILSPAPIVIADEPTGQLDEANSELVVHAFKVTARRKIVLVATHDPSFVHQADDAWYLRDGTIRSTADV